MEQGTTKELEDIVNALKCPKDFSCYKEHYESLCEAENSGINEFLLECREKGRLDCKFLLSYGYEYYCNCPLAIYIAKKLKN